MMRASRAGGQAYSGAEEIYRVNVDWLSRVMHRIVCNRRDAENLTAEVFLTALRPLKVSASSRTPIIGMGSLPPGQVVS